MNIDDGYDGGTCSCGSAWFRLVEGAGGPGIVTVNDHGMITGSSGSLVCDECAMPWRPPRERLSIVPRPVAAVGTDPVTEEERGRWK